MRLFNVLLTLSLLGGSWCAPAAAPSAKPPAEPVPTYANVSYGPHTNQLMDVFVPTNGPGPFPVVLWYGGIWKPAKHAADPRRLNAAGCAVVAVETRTITDGMEAKANPPVSFVLNDACRAVQFVRMNAAKWRLDGKRIGLGGGSQGALPALFVGCAGERANPQSADPVERFSTRVTCVVAYRSQPSIDPKRMQDWVPGVKWGAPALGCSFEESLARREELLPLIEKWSPDYLLTRDAAPMYFENEWGMVKPADIEEANYKVHSPAWGIGFQKLAQQAGATCYLRYLDHPSEKYRDFWDFLVQQLK